MNRKAETTSCMVELGVEMKNKQQVPKFLGQEREWSEGWWKVPTVEEREIEINDRNLKMEVSAWEGKSSPRAAAESVGDRHFSWGGKARQKHWRQIEQCVLRKYMARPRLGLQKPTQRTFSDTRYTLNMQISSMSIKA